MSGACEWVWLNQLPRHPSPKHGRSSSIRPASWLQKKVRRFFRGGA